MTKKEIEEIYKQAKKDVSVHCDDYHAHTALGGCLSGDPHAINVCKLCQLLPPEGGSLRKLKTT